MQPLQLISIGEVMKGGTTKPVNIIALNNDKPTKYVMKVFTKSQIIQGASVAKEIICNELAKQFDLNCPDYGIIKLDHSEFMGVYDEERITKLDNGYKFCSKYLEGNAMFNPLVTNSFLKDYEVATIFAFDLLIYNSDRGGFRNKPNLLINDNALYLIDHELTFPFIGEDINNVNYERYLGNYPFKQHVLIRYLKSLRNKNDLFNEFIEMLKVLNLNDLSSIFDFLEEFNIAHVERQKFMHYFAWAKNNVAIFDRYLKAMVQ